MEFFSSTPTDFGRVSRCVSNYKQIRYFSRFSRFILEGDSIMEAPFSFTEKGDLQIDASGPWFVLLVFTKV